MKVKQDVGVYGRPRITVFDVPLEYIEFVREAIKDPGINPKELLETFGETAHAIVGPNIMVNNGLKGILDVLGNNAASTSINGPDYVWVGSGADDPVATNTNLGTYESEKQFTSYIRPAGGYVGSWTTTYADTEGNHEWEEIAMANGAHGSGIMWTHYLFTAQKFTKLNTQFAVVEYELSISEG